MSDSEHAQGAAQSARLSYEHAKDAAAQVVGQVRERAADYFAKGKEKAKSMQGATEEFIRENPVKSILIAAGAGLLVGFLLRRR
jgi:ElaB/YqjD/DUF883 family membrane-anchored ribosome-binding protein